MNENEKNARLEAAKEIANQAGALALDYFRDITALDIKSKGAQDMVSNADLAVETFVRDRLSDVFPNDGIIGEEHENVEGSTGWIWVIDPIDGTANFVAGIPQWCVILACVHSDTTQLGAIFEPCNNEMYSTAKGQGAFLNDKPISVAETSGLDHGSVGVGMNGRTPVGPVITLISDLVNRGGVFFRNASGGLMLAYVAAGRLIGYTEPHMNAWDCLAGQLLISEAGGMVEDQSAEMMLSSGGRVIAGTPEIYAELLEISNAAYLSD